MIREENEEEVCPDSVKSAETLIKTLVKALKNLKIYLPNNPVHQRFLKEFHSKLETHLSEYGELVLTVGQYSLTCQDHVIYENLNRLESLAFRMFIDGIRQITLLVEITEEESGDLLEILGKTYDSTHPDDDLVTLFWQKHFRHIKCQILEDIFSTETEETTGSTKDLKSGFTSLIQSELKNNSSQAAEGKSLAVEQSVAQQYHQIFRLTEDEIAKIKEEMKTESEKDLISEMTEIIHLVLQVEKDSQFFSEIIDLLGGNMTHFLEEANFIQMEKIANLFDKLKKQLPPLSEANKTVLDNMINSLGTPECLNKVERHINDLDEKNLKAFSTFLGLLNPSAICSIIDILGKAKVRRVRKALSDVLVELGKKDILPILNRIQGSQWFVIRNLVQVIGRIGNQQALNSLRKLIQYPDERVRKEVIHTLNIIGKENEKANEMILSFLNDRDAGIRKQTIQTVQLNKEAKALPILKQIIEEEDFESKELEERKLLFGALGRLGNDDLIPILKSYLKPTLFFWVKRKKKEEKGICAIHALKSLETSQAITLLMEAKKHPYKLIRDISERTLFEIQRIKEKRELSTAEKLKESDK